MTVTNLSQCAKQLGLKINSKQNVRVCLRKEMLMTYRTKIANDLNANSEANLILRQMFVKLYLNVLESGKVIINLDESAVT